MQGCDNINSKKNARNILANNIVFFRLENGWSQEDFADKLDTTVTYISSLENAKRNSRIDYVEHIADVLGIEMYQLFKPRNKVDNNRIPRRPKNM